VVSIQDDSHTLLTVDYASHHRHFIHLLLLHSCSLSCFQCLPHRSIDLLLELAIHGLDGCVDPPELSFGVLHLELQLGAQAIVGLSAQLELLFLCLDSLGACRG